MRHAGVFRTLGLAIVVASQFTALAASGQWSTDVTVNNALCTAVRDQVAPLAVSDGAGGAIVTWYDQRGGVGATFNDVYAQRISAGGVVRWAADGVGICLATSSQSEPAIAGDGAGGAIIVWVDYRSTVRGDLYAQRIGPDGTPLWTANGVPVNVGGFNDRNPVIVADGAGGAVIAWSTSQNLTTIEDIYAQRIDAQGEVQWPTDGVPVSLAARYQVYPRLVGDGHGGAIIAWFDARDDLTTGTDIYAQWLDSAGTPQWTTDGLAVCTATGAQYDVAVAGDGAAGAIICWTDGRGANTDIYAQRVNPAGTLLWTANGRGIATYAANQVTPRIAADGAGGAVIAWSTSGTNIGGQRIDAAGAPLWGGGVGLSTTSQAANPQVIATSTGGAIVTYNDRRAGGDDVYAQKIETGGTVSWGPTGRAVSQATGGQTLAQLVSDGHDGAVFVWYDSRTSATTGTDIYAQQVGASGTPGDVTGITAVPDRTDGFVLRQNCPNPFNPRTTISYVLPRDARVSLRLFDLQGRQVATLVSGEQKAGARSVQWNGGRFASGQYFYRLEAGGLVATRKLLLLK